MMLKPIKLTNLNLEFKTGPVLKAVQKLREKPRKKLREKPRKKTGEKLKGFTLLELLIAMSIFSILSLMAYSGLESIITTKTHTEAVSKRLVKLQQAFMFIGRDIEQAIGRSVRNGYGEPEPAMVGSSFGQNIITLTRAGYTNPMKVTRSTLQRVAYRFEDNKLLRLSWKMLDQDFTQTPQMRELLDGVEKVEIRYIDQSSQLQDQWPNGFGANFNTMLPRAVEFKITLKDMGEIRRLFSVVQ